MRLRFWLLTALLGALACGRTALEASPQNAGGISGPGVGDTGGAPTGTGGTAGAGSGPCGKATCLASLFQTCAPAGSCVWHGAGGPDAVAYDTCYANGVTVHSSSGWNGTDVTSRLTVLREGKRCYAIESISGGAVSAITYVISGPDGDVATAVTADKAGSVSVTCHGQQPVPANVACFSPVSSGDDGCTPGDCP